MDRSAASRILHMLAAGWMACAAAPAPAGDDPLWDLSRDAIPRDLVSGNADKLDGKVSLRDGSAFAIPAAAFPDQKNFTVQVTLCVDALLEKSLLTFMNKQTTKDDGFDFSIKNIRSSPGNYEINASVNKILMTTWQACGKPWPQIGTPYTFTLAVRNGVATFYFGDRPIKTCLMEVVPNDEPMWIGRNTDPKAGHLPVTIHDVKVYGPDRRFVSKSEENSTRRIVGGQGWAIDAPKVIEHPEWPKVLIYGDSISGGYRPRLEPELLKNNIYLFHFVGFVGGEVPEDAIAQAAASHAFDVVVFNNGLHSLHWTPAAVPDEVVIERMRKITRSFRKGAPKARVFYLSTTPHTAPRPAPDKPVEGLGDKNDVVVRLNTLSTQVMQEEVVEWIDVYSLLAARRDLANGDQYHWQAPAYEIISGEVTRRILPALQKTRAAP